MGTVDRRFAADLRDQLGLRRAVETGTFRGITARSLASLFDSVTTIELSEALHERVIVTLSDLPHVEAIQGHSVSALDTLASQDIPTLYFLDGHWSAGDTGGADDECPVLAEIAAIGAGHPDDCLIVDDANLFASAPMPPLDPSQWPTFAEVIDAMRVGKADHVVTVLGNQVIAVPTRAKPALNAYGARLDRSYCVRLQTYVTNIRNLIASRFIHRRNVRAQTD